MNSIKEGRKARRLHNEQLDPNYSLNKDFHQLAQSMNEKGLVLKNPLRLKNIIRKQSERNIQNRIEEEASG